MSKVDRRILKSQEAIRKAIIELMSEKTFNDITIQEISDRANVSRRTIYLHYTDKFDLLDKLIEEHINKLRELCESAADMSHIDAELLSFKYFERNYLFFSSMLASQGAPYFHRRFLEFILERIQYKLERIKNKVDVKEGINHGLSECDDVFIQFFGAAFVGIVEWWFKNGMPYPPHVMAQRVGILLDRNL